MAEREKFSLAKPLVYLVLCGYLMVVVYPMLWLLYTSLKTDREIFLNPFSLPELDHLQWINFTNAWTKGHFGDYFFNSVFLTVATVAVSMLLAAMAAYALARFSFFGVRPMFFYFLAGLMIPLQLSIVPLFFQMKDFGLLNSRLGILMVYVAFGMPFAIFILTGFFKSLPSGLHESALIDGAGEFRAFWSIMLPLARPALVASTLICFAFAWNEFLFASVLANRDWKPYPMLVAGSDTVRGIDFGFVTTRMLIAVTVPVILSLMVQRFIVRGLTFGAVKG